MAELLAKSAVWGLAPVEKAGLVLTPVEIGQITNIALFPQGKEAAIASLKPMGLGWPAPGRMLTADDLRLVWSGRDEALLFGAVPLGLASLAAVTDQSSAFGCVTVDGKGGAALLARILPLDLRPAVFAPGSVARSLAGHIPALLLRPEMDRFEILVPRSMVGSFWHEICAALNRLAARQKA